MHLPVQNRRVVLITNVKPGKLRDVVSEGLVIILSNIFGPMFFNV